ncbi:hypothetical protein LCGC14_3156250 [marine sediment metagenome]|uniref:Uncharacterized protein n=1 Tax=marine sediment metagenome TaxID=412755 RepID=A0A0F8WGN7_9ZZZZ
MIGKGVFIVSKDGNIFGKADKTKWNALKWYKKLYGFFNRQYKSSHIEIKPFTIIGELDNPE